MGEYKAPPSTPSSVGPQIRTDFYKRKALIEAMHSQHFQPLADVTAMPKHYGKKIKQYLYIPLLDDRNVSDEGIDAAGAIIQNSLKTVVLAKTVFVLADGTAATAGAAAVNAVEAGVAAVQNTNEVAVTKTVIFDATDVQADAIIAALGQGSYKRDQAGNLYGSSRDIGMIPDRFPSLSETGGRVNRVGFTRLELEGNLNKYGFFDEFTQESLDFDTDDMLEEHINREMLRGASQITEDMLQLDLLNAAGVVKYAGAATSIATVAAADRVTYGDLVQLGITLDKNLTPKKTTIITGSRMIDTKVIPAARLMFIGSELLPDLMQLKNYHDKEAFIPVEQYGNAAGYLFNDEAGSIAGFRVIVNHEMLKHAGKGAAANVGEQASHYTTGAQFDVFPMLVVGEGSFTTVGFQGGRDSTSKFTVFHKKPGMDTADHRDPFGETGFMSIKWYYGFMALRNERIAVQWTAARM
jgi:N4-gp56 family major capsid protein